MPHDRKGSNKELEIHVSLKRTSEAIQEGFEKALVAQGKKTDREISSKAFRFHDFDGRKDSSTILAWLSQLDDYFSREFFFEKDKVKCAVNHLMGSAALWWNATKFSCHRPETWQEFKHDFKNQFLPPRYKFKVRRQWDTISQRKGEDVQSYIDRFWTSLIQVQAIEKVK